MISSSFNEFEDSTELLFRYSVPSESPPTSSANTVPLNVKAKRIVKTSKNIFFAFIITLPLNFLFNMVNFPLDNVNKLQLNMAVIPYISFMLLLIASKTAQS